MIYFNIIRNEYSHDRIYYENLSVNISDSILCTTNNREKKMYAS